MKALKHRFLPILLTLCLLLSLCACSASAKPADAPKAADGPGEAAPDEPHRNGSDGEAFPAAEPGPGPELPADGGFSYDMDGGAFYYGKGGEAASPAPAAPGGTGASSLGEGRSDSGEPGSLDDPLPPEEPAGSEPVFPEPPDYQPGEALKLTAAEWNDNRNWPFFTNLVNAGTVSFPSFGLDPRNRLEVLVTDASEPAVVSPRANETVRLLDAEGNVLWTARTDKSGLAYVFWAEGRSPDRVVCGEVSAPVQAPAPSEDPQGRPLMRPLETVVLSLPDPAPVQEGLQVLFIVDTTGSMVDEIAYLQKDFSAIAERVGSEGVQWSASFYRDEGDLYLTRHNPFSSDVAEIQRKLNAEYADGGGDEPEAVAQVLRECLQERSDWDEAASKLAFLIFDAPPHEGTDAELQAAVQAAAEQGIRLIPVVASNANRGTELFGRALAILTNGTYVFLTDDSGVGESHLEPIVGDYEVELLQDLIVKIIERFR